MRQLAMANKSEAEQLRELLSDKRYRLNNLYMIRDPAGKPIKFKMNWAQENLFDNLWYYNVVLKARQLGFSTFIMIYLLDHCLFEANQACGVIAQGLNEASDLFENKIKFAYDNLPTWLKDERKAVTDTARKLVFANGSSITVATSHRSGTLQKLHVSEYGKIAARYPDKAKEIKSGALNTLAPGQMIFIESTAEGRQGEFFDVCQQAIKLKESGAQLSQLDPRMHFYPWYLNPSNVLSDADCGRVSLTDKDHEYFSKIAYELTPNQKAWYVKKLEQMGDHEIMKREHPSNYIECFEASLEGAYYANQMAQVRKNKQITLVQYEPTKPVHTFWDLGISDNMGIWFFQHIGNQYRFIRYYENSGEGLGHYATKLQSYGYVYGDHYFPHDGDTRRLGVETRSAREIAQSLGIRPIQIVPRTNSVQDDIQAIRVILPRCFFDEQNCKDGLICLDSYRKEWDDRLGVWKDSPRHDFASHGADAFRTFLGYQERKREFMDRSIEHSVAQSDYNPFEV